MKKKSKRAMKKLRKRLEENFAKPIEESLNCGCLGFDNFIEPRNMCSCNECVCVSSLNFFD